MGDGAGIGCWPGGTTLVEAREVWRAYAVSVVTTAEKEESHG
jgi:hypothetical protein